jgi:putative restriction endonuclease
MSAADSTIVRRTESPSVVAERARRYRVWSELTTRYPGGLGAPASFVRQLGIYGGMGQGIFVDKKRTTGAIVKNGVAVGLNWANGYAEDGAEGDQFIYGYPSTRRPGLSDSNEIAAVKNARGLDLPVFFIDAVTSPSARNVRLAWVLDWDDAQRAFVLVFSEPERQTEIRTPTQPFVLDKTGDDRVGREAKDRPGQRMFKYRVLKRYGSQCALCSLSIPPLLDAAHLKPSALLGTDDERNGLVLCKVHHTALDKRLIAINPKTLCVELLDELYSLDQLKIEHTSILHLREKPAMEAIEWLYAHRTISYGEPS